MKIEDLLKQLKVEFIKVNLIQSSLDTIIFFLISNLCLFVTSIELINSLENYTVLGVLSFFFFIPNLIYRTRTYHLELYEEKNPDLKEVLRTARDNVDKSNTVSKALFEEVKSRTRKMTSETIIPSRKIIEKVIVIGVLCFLTVGSGLTNFQISGPDDSMFTGLNLSSDTETGDDRVQTINGSNILSETNASDVEAANIKFDIQGGGESSNGDFDFTSSNTDLTFQSSNQTKQENRRLAKQYSIAIKEFD